VRKALAVFLLLCAFVSSGYATIAAADHPGSLPILLGLEKVRSELKLDSLQRALLDSLRAEYKAAARKVTSTIPPTPGERAAAEKKFRQLNEHFNRRALSMLNEDQRAKLTAIERKSLGSTMVYMPSVQAKLGLTEQQKKKVEAIRRQGLLYVAKINRRFEQGKISQQQRLQLLRSRRSAQGAQILQVLTPEQRNEVLTLGGKKVQS
jgi:hypothetical protein